MHSVWVTHRLLGLTDPWVLCKHGLIYVLGITSAHFWTTLRSSLNFLNRNSVFKLMDCLTPHCSCNSGSQVSLDGTHVLCTRTWLVLIGGSTSVGRWSHSIWRRGSWYSFVLWIQISLLIQILIEIWINLCLATLLKGVALWYPVVLWIQISFVDSNSGLKFGSQQVEPFH